MNAERCWEKLTLPFNHYVIFRIYVQNLTTIGLVVSEITCPIKMGTDAKQTDRQTETRDYFFRTLGVMKLRENIKMAIRPMLLYFFSLRLGNKNLYL